MQIRAVNADEADQFLTVFCAAFRMDRDAALPLFYGDPYFDLSLKRICISDGAQIVSCLTVIPTQLRVGGAVIPMGGIAGVATHPQYQRRGYGGELLSGTIRTMQTDMGCPLSGLFPADPEYYARFGWSFATTYIHWTSLREALPHSRDAGRVRPVDGSNGYELAAIAEIHDTQTVGRTGACRRGSARWRTINELLSGRQMMVCEEGGVVTGYLHYEPVDTVARLVIHEMHATTDVAVQSLLGYVAVQDRYHEIEWPASPADLARFGLFGGDVVPDAMLRITDLHAALTLAHSANYSQILADERVMLTVIADDAIVPANRQPVLLTPDGVQTVGIADGNAIPGSHVQSSSVRGAGGEGSGWISADIGVITQLYVGYVTPSDACAQGLLKASDASALALADRLFPARNPSIASLDHF